MSQPLSATRVAVHFEPSVPNATQLLRLLDQAIAPRVGAPVAAGPRPGACAAFGIDASLPPESYRIESDSLAGVRVCAADPAGLICGVGAFLRKSRYSPGVVSPPAWRGVSTPQAPVRGMYCAFNFSNWYVSCPREEFARYMDELALWGLNTIFISVIMENPANAEAFERRKADNREVLGLIKRAGMKAGLLVTPNVFSIPAPQAARAVDVADATPPRRGNVDHRVCPSHPEGYAWMRDMLRRHLDGYENVGVDCVATFPYDAGGCGCPRCAPWGCNGYLAASRACFELARERFPACKRILTTWCFDVLDQPEGEYAGLDKLLRENPDWADYIMADAHGDFPRYPLDVGVPGGKPMVNFPEISMWGRYPWGGYGANPLPERFQKLWDQVKPICRGGFPYSEGIFEDINKTFCARFYWDASARAGDTLREYIAYEFSPDCVDDVVEAVTLLEKTWEDRHQFPDAVANAWAILQRVDAVLPARAKSSWRWRILYLRGLIDAELAARPGQPHSDKCDEAFEELTAIYHAENTDGPDAPRSRRCAARLARRAEVKPAGAV